MKKIIYLTSIIILLLSTIIFTTKVFSQEGEERVSAFHKSLELAYEGDYSSAISELTKVYNKFGKDYLINLRLGYLYYLNKDYDKSISYYQKAIELTNNNSIEPMLGLTLPLAAKEKWNDVEKIYIKILNIDPKNYTANLRLGQIYFNRREYSKAENFLSKVLESFTSDYEANLYLGWTYFYLNKKSEAKEKFIRALMVSPKDKSALEGLNLVK